MSIDMTYLIMNRLGMWIRQTEAPAPQQVYSAQIILVIDDAGEVRCTKNIHGPTGEAKAP